MDGAGIEALPAELLSRVFAYLSSDSYHVEITNCRLVSRQWREISLPFLITTVVIADRLKTLQKLREVLEHPYFSRHVTRLVWDASHFSPHLGVSFHFYKRHFDDYSWRHPGETQQARSRQADKAGLESLLQNAPNQATLAPQREYFTTFLEDDDVGDHRNEHNNRQNDSMESLDRGFLQYHRLYQQQLDIRGRRLSLRYLHASFEKLPKLRHFEFTDFRALSRNGETFLGLCTRLFGDMIWPNVLSDKDYRRMNHLEMMADWSPLNHCLRNLLKINPKLESISLGRSNFQSPYALEALGHPRVRFDDSNIPDDEEGWSQMLSRVHHLELPVDTTAHADDALADVPHLEMPKRLGRLLSFGEASIRHLDLSAKTYSGHYPALKNGALAYREVVEPYFSEILGLRQFQKLQSLVLRGWLLPLTDLQRFLINHAKTLKELHIIDCCMSNCKPGMLRRAIEGKLQSVLSLHGAEVYGLNFEHEHYGQRRGSGVLHSLEWRMPNDCMQPQIEKALLCGRPNQIHRVMQGKAITEFGRWWTETSIEDFDDEENESDNYQLPRTPPSDDGYDDFQNHGNHFWDDYDSDPGYWDRYVSNRYLSTDGEDEGSDYANQVEDPGPEFWGAFERAMAQAEGPRVDRDEGEVGLHRAEPGIGDEDDFDSS